MADDKDARVTREPETEEATSAPVGAWTIAAYRAAGAPYGWHELGVVRWLREQLALVRCASWGGAPTVGETDPRRRHTQRPEQRPR